MEIAGAIAGIEQVVPAEEADNRPDTLRTVLEETIDALYRFILVRVRGDRDAADDLLQQTCCEATRHRRPPGNNGECEAWLRGIARNLIRQHWRQSKRRSDFVCLEEASRAAQLADDLESRPLPEDALVKDESAAHLLLAITSLPAADQGLIFAYYFDGRPQATIARELGVTEKSIESRLFRARGRLRTTLRGMERSGEQ